VAALVMLGLLLAGSVGTTSPRQSDALLPTSGDKVVAMVSHPALPLPPQATPLRPVINALAGNAHPAGAALASGPSVLGAPLILLLLFLPGQRALGVAGHRANASRAPPVAS
jgi:hypothetical protein